MQVGCPPPEVAGAAPLERPFPQEERRAPLGRAAPVHGPGNRAPSARGAPRGGGTDGARSQSRGGAEGAGGRWPMGGGRADGGGAAGRAGRGVGSRRCRVGAREEPAEPEEDGGGGAAPRPRPDRSPARSLERRPIAPAAAGGSRPPPARARCGQGPGRWAAPGSGGWRGGGPGRRRRELAGCSRSRRTASPRCVRGDERREARRGPLGSLRVVSRDRPEVRGCPWGRLGGPTARPGRGAGVRLADAPALRSLG